MEETQALSPEEGSWLSSSAEQRRSLLEGKAGALEEQARPWGQTQAPARELERSFRNSRGFLEASAFQRGAAPVYTHPGERQVGAGPNGGHLWEWGWRQFQDLYVLNK